MSIFACIAWLVWGFVIGCSVGAWAASALLVAKRFTFKNHYTVKHAVFTMPTVRTLELNGVELSNIMMEKTGLFDDPHTYTKQ